MAARGGILLQRLLVASLFLDLAFKLATDWALAHEAAQPLLIYVGQVGVYLTLAPLALFGIAKGGVRLTKTQAVKSIRSAFIVSVLALLYVSLWGCLGLLIGQSAVDVAGSTARVALPFLLLFAIVVSVAGSPDTTQRRFIRTVVRLLLLFLIGGAIGKAILMASGQFYGGGLHQFRISGFLLSLLLLIVLKARTGNATRGWLAVLIVTLLVLSVLSLKRAAWLELSIAMLLTAFAFPIRDVARLVVFSILVCAAGVLVVQQSGLSANVAARVDYTFSGSGTGAARLDRSSYARLAELRAAAYTLEQTPWRVGWITGLGPGAGYLNPEGYNFRNLNARGEPYHIHAAIGIIVFRYGLIGLFFHVILIGMAGMWLFRFARGVASQHKHDVWDVRLVGMASVIGIMAQLPFLLTGNLYFGQLLFGVYLGVALLCRSVIQREMRIVSTTAH